MSFGVTLEQNLHAPLQCRLVSTPCCALRWSKPSPIMDFSAMGKLSDIPEYPSASNGTHLLVGQTTDSSTA